MNPIKRLSKKEMPPRVLAIDPTATGFGYTLFENSHRLIDWGVTSSRFCKFKSAQKQFDKLINRYKPNVLVIENTFDLSTRRGKTAKKMLTQFAHTAIASMIPVKRYSREDIKQAFSEFGSCTKEEIADHLIEWLPELKTYRPPKREIWMAEDPKMAIFDAASFAIVFYAKHEEQLLKDNQ